MNEILGVIRTGAILAGTGGGLFLAYHGARRVYDDVHERLHQAELDRITRHDLAQQADLANIREIQADARGRYPLLYGVNGVIRDPASLRSFTLDTVLERWPYLDRVQIELEALRQLVTAKPPGSYHYEHIIGDQLAPGQEAAAELPAATLEASTLDGLLAKYSFAPRLHSILIGEYLDDQGKAQPLTLDLPKSVHVLATGASGLGKSTLLEAMAVQLAGLAGVHLAAIDYGSGTFDALEGALHWQLADSPGLAIALFHELIKMLQERRGLYREVGRVRSLDQYNAMTGNDLPFVTVFVDETSALVEHEGTKEPLIELARLGRKYGLGLILAGTDFKASTLPSEARSNCLARLAFWLEPGLSQSLLGNRAASDDTLSIGDIVAKRPGTPGTTRGHTPMVTQASYARLAQRAGACLELPEVEIVEASPSKGNGAGQAWTPEQAQEVLERHAAGDSDTKIAGALWHPNPYYIDRVRSIIAENESASAQVHQNQDGDREHDQEVGACACEFCGRDVGKDDFCQECGLWACAECLTDGLCPDCRGSE